MPSDVARLLFRGVSIAHHEALGGLLTPKRAGPFTHAFAWDDEGATWDSGITFDESEANAVIQHELLQQGFPTSGVSTTPHPARARFYATSGGKESDGIIYVIDGTRLESAGVRSFPVADYAAHPSVPEDAEVILCFDGGSPLPAAVLAATLRVTELDSFLSSRAAARRNTP